MLELIVPLSPRGRALLALSVTEPRPTGRVRRARRIERGAIALVLVFAAVGAILGILSPP